MRLWLDINDNRLRQQYLPYTVGFLCGKSVTNDCKCESNSYPKVCVWLVWNLFVTFWFNSSYRIEIFICSTNRGSQYSKRSSAAACGACSSRRINHANQYHFSIYFQAHSACRDYMYAKLFLGCFYTASRLLKWGDGIYILGEDIFDSQRQWRSLLAFFPW